MKLRIFVEPQQGASYDQQVRMAQAAESSGFDAFFRSDHFLAMGGDGLPGPTDAWLTLAGIARETDRIRLGTMVTSATFRSSPWPSASNGWRSSSPSSRDSGTRRSGRLLTSTGGTTN
jgi:alkanesulfonate monooxygenase SsuD/methylene tetrahydromethanopterin reductase-like flavin-dependent oxidoreductase (luciferase family)